MPVFWERRVVMKKTHFPSERGKMSTKSDADAAAAAIVEHFVLNGRLVIAGNRDGFKRELGLNFEFKQSRALSDGINEAIKQGKIVYAKHYGNYGFCSAVYAKSYRLKVLEEPGLSVVQPTRQSVNA
jgi:hypothetical protein